MNTTERSKRCPAIPHRAWYAAATPDEIGRNPLARKVLGQRLALYRTTDGTVVALEDRCAHRPVALSQGRVEGDDVIAPYTGFRYAPDGACVGVPTQEQVPFGARVRAFPVVDDGTFVWVWMGDPALARLRPPPALKWLSDDAWASFGDVWETNASLEVMQDNFADITHVPYVDETIAPPALSGATPDLQVQFTETTVSFARDFPAAPVAEWQADLMGVPRDSEHPQREEGEFVAPGLWVDRWHVDVDGAPQTFVFAHVLTPIDERTTRHLWRVSRNFATDTAAQGTLTPLLTTYYRKVQEILEGIQAIVDDEGPRPDVQVAADAAGAQVRKIMARLVADE